MVIVVGILRIGLCLTGCRGDGIHQGLAQILFLDGVVYIKGLAAHTARLSHGYQGKVLGTSQIQGFNGVTQTILQDIFHTDIGQGHIAGVGNGDLIMDGFIVVERHIGRIEDSLFNLQIGIGIVSLGCYSALIIIRSCGCVCCI